MASKNSPSASSLLTLTELTRSHDPWRWARWAVALSLVGVFALAAFRLGAIRGWTMPLRVAESSMAGTLLGEHFAVRCPDCGIEFACDAESPPGDMRAICPNCGKPDNDLRQADRRPGTRVVIDRFATLSRSPQVGDLVAVRDPELPGRMLVKRVAALAGQQWGVDDGDLMLDGKVYQKEMDQLRKQLLVVYDHDFPPRAELKLPARWQPIARGDSNHWRAETGGFRFLGQASAQNEATGYFYDWIGYRHWRRLQVGAATRAEPAPIMDDNYYDADENHPPHEVHDVYLRFKAMMDHASCLVIAAEDGPLRFEVHLCREERQIKVFRQVRGEPPVLVFDPPPRLPYRLSEQPMVLELALCDKRLLFAVDYRQLFAAPYERRLTARKSTDGCRFEIGASGAPNAIAVHDLTVARDIFYVDPAGLRRPWMADERVPPGAVALLGDNPHVSRDSRQWKTSGLPLTDVLGRVYPPFFGE